MTWVIRVTQPSHGLDYTSSALRDFSIMIEKEHWGVKGSRVLGVKEHDPGLRPLLKSRQHPQALA
jgi:hypothetical protein